MEPVRVHHKANNRGHIENEWLATHYSFSFADFFDPTRMGFGALLVVNDDTIKGGYGFGFHPHKNMEIITIPWKGSLTHRDSMGNEKTVGRGEAGYMSAGSGVVHSEMNADEKEPVHVFQVWIKLARTEGYLDMNNKRTGKASALCLRLRTERVAVYQYSKMRG